MKDILDLQKRNFIENGHPSLEHRLDRLKRCVALIETHDDPDNAPSDGPNMIKLSNLKNLLEQLQQFDVIAKKNA